MVLQGISSNNNTTITWTVPASPSPSVNPSPNATVNINPAVSGSTANITVVGIFTVGATDNNNQCRATKTVQINQDLRRPVFTISALTNSIITCKNPDVLIVPVVSTLIASQLVPTYTWFPPVGNPVPGTQFNSTAPGTHSAISMSGVNGCTTSASYNIGLDLNPPAVDFSQTFTLDCGVTPSVQIFPTINGPTTGLTYNWYIFPAGVLVTNPSVAVIVASLPGEYGVVITNTANGCKADGSFNVTEGALSVDFTPSTTFGYAPLNVTFANNSASTFTTGTMISNWSFGNGTVLTNTYVNNSSPVTPAATYTAPGTYSVHLTTTKGSCVGSKVRVIIVEVPSKIEVPNIFTPNGDKVNDIFRLIASGLATVDAKIFDRWGNKVYDVMSETGNIAWDGKNLSGKDCPAGTYFYIIKATGKDGEEYDLKGNVTLIR
jgi:gliding motility-associated-like protein